MPAIHLFLDGDHEKVGHAVGTDRYPIIHTMADWTIDAMEKGMVSGATSIMLLVPVVVEGVDCLVAAETSLQMWMSTATALAAKFSDEVTKPGWAVLSPAARDALRPRYAEAIRRSIPSATAEQALQAAEMMFDAVGADAPEDLK